MKQLAFATPSQPLRVAKQQRSRILMQSVREATIELLHRVGPEEITTVKIAERAGISIGSLYRYYPNKEAILTDIYDEELSRLDRRLRARMRPDSSNDRLEDLIREGVELTIQFHRDLLALNARFFITFRQNFNITDRRGPAGAGSWDVWAERWFLEVLENNRHRLKVTDLRAAARLMIDMASGTIHRITETRPQALDDSQLVEQLTALISGYLFAAPR
jgi:AcrR family transcriptional regulator